MRPGAVASAAELPLRTNLSMWMTRGGLIGMLLITLLGPVLAYTRGAGWSFDSDLGFYGFLIGALFVLRSGLEEQRDVGLVVYLRQNLMTHVEHSLGLFISLIASWLVLCIFGFLGLLIATAGDAATAAWHTWAWGGQALMLAGFVPLVEAVSRFRLPFVLVAIIYFALVIAGSLVLGEARLGELLVVLDRGDPSTTLRMLGRIALSLAITLAAFVGMGTLRWRGRGFRKKTGPSRH